MSTITGIPTYFSAPINPNTVTPSKARSPTALGLGSSKDALSPTTPAINTASTTSSSSSPSAGGQTPRSGAAAIDLLPAPTGAITLPHHNELPPPTRTTILRPTDQPGSATEKPKHASISSKTTGDFVPPPPQPGARPQPVAACPRGSPPRPVPDSAPFLAPTGTSGSGSSAPSGPAATTVIPLPANGQSGRSARGNNHNIPPYSSHLTPVVPNSTSTPYAAVYTPPTPQQDRNGNDGVLPVAKSWIQAAGMKLAEAEAEIWRRVK